MSHTKIKLSIFALLLALPLLLSGKTTEPPPLAPGPNDGNISYITARLLEEFHYTQHPFDTDISKKFYDGYLDYYDPQHLYFLQSDIAEFAHYRTNLDVLTLGSHGQADVKPAYKIFNRFMERLEERADYANQLLAQDHFDFNTDEQVQIDRKNAPYPKDLDAAKNLWRQQLLWQVLQEKLDRRENFPKTANTETNLADIAQTIQHRYEREVRMFHELDGGDVMQAYLDSLAHAYDPHSDYLNNEHAQDFSISMSLSLGGIGAELAWEDGYCKVQSLVPGGPAEKSNQLKPNDKIIAVAQGSHAPVDVVNMELGKIVQLIRGTKGTEVRLTIIPADDPSSRRIVKLVRAEINLSDERAKAELIETPDGHGGTNRIGVIHVPQFYAPVSLSGNSPQATNYISVDVAELVHKLTQEGAGGIILDLRGNPGGSLEEAIQFVGLFVTNGPVVQIRSPEGHNLVERDDDAPNIYHGPLLVLVSRLSASASEIVAAALQDYGRALIVGDTSSFGKGTVQNLTPLAPLVWPASESATNDPGTVKITIRKFYRINGASTQLKGVIPDIILPDALSARNDIGESALPNALAWDTIPAADYGAVNEVQPYLGDLQKASNERVATNQDFAYVRQDMAEVVKVQSQKTDTLNERKAWDEKEKFAKESKARQREIASRKPPEETIYPITVADASAPGLPLAVKFVKAPPTLAVGLVPGTVAPEYGVVYPPNAINNSFSTNAIPIDPVMDESKRILQDYIAHWPLSHDEIATHE
ncbi:MAG TPA: carboxy terminal-processing peptidase [Pseudomonadales bacterium]|nr:carboxy terminal-processing peptidase [Pseudomonadales bacterium]